MANAGWSLLAGGAAIGIVGGFLLAMRWQQPVLPPEGISPAPGTAAAPAEPSPELVRAIETQAARITRLEQDVERLSGTVRDLTRALREATDRGAAQPAAPRDSALPWLPRGGLNVAKAWYAERIAASIQGLATQADGLQDGGAKRELAEQGKLQQSHLQSLQRATTVEQFAAWLQSTGHGEQVPSAAELDALARRLAESGK